MPLIVGGQIANTQTVVQETTAPVSPTPSVSLEEIRRRRSAEIQNSRAPNRNVAPAYPRMQINPNDHLVVVDGKVKKIGKQSKYLLDMLTIEE